MSNVSGVNGSSALYSAEAYGAAGLSPDMLLAYCQTQLGGLDGEIKNDIDRQNLQLQEREAAEKATSALEQYGDNGPTSADEMQKCVDAVNQAVSGLPADDPVRLDVEANLKTITDKYNFQSGTPSQLTTDQKNQLDSLNAQLAQAQANSDDLGVYQIKGQIDAITKNGTVDQGSAATWSGALANGEWKGFTDTFNKEVDDIKSNAEIQMLQLQDLVSQRQQAVSMASGMMSKEDQSLEQLARLGQG